MNDLEFKPWIKKTRDDLKNAEILLEKRMLPWIICFHCQQAIEKYLKALQIVHLGNYQKVHDLVKFFQTLDKIINTKDQEIETNLLLINDFYIADRYPTGEIVQIKINQAEVIFQLTKKIIKVLQKYLPKD